MKTDTKFSDFNMLLTIFSFFSFHFYYYLIFENRAADVFWIELLYLSVFVPIAIYKIVYARKNNFRKVQGSWMGYFIVPEVFIVCRWLNNQKETLGSVSDDYVLVILYGVISYFTFGLRFVKNEKK